MTETSNYKKNTNKNLISKFFLNNFYTVLLDELKNLHPQSILDAGCGEGFFLTKLSHAKIGKKLEGIEYGDEAIKIGKKLHPTIIIKKADIYKLPYRNNSFDVVVCTEVLEHLVHPEKALLELKRVAKKYIVLSVPNEPLFTIQRVLRGKNILHLGAHPEHIQHWSSSTFKKFVTKYVKVIDDMTPLPWTLVVAEK
ncbi:MAG TPA: class I SAM-dependent methyltransferase [Methylomirabilota bacterium]|nr:class I SAM-dependent methyltransferase [Methylomirabilota bacterium]